MYNAYYEYIRGLEHLYVCKHIVRANQRHEYGDNIKLAQCVDVDSEIVRGYAIICFRISSRV